MCSRRFEKAVEVAKTERINGKFLIDEQWVQQTLAEMLSNVMIGRSMYVSAGMCEQRNGMMSLMTHPLLTGLQAVAPQFVFLLPPFKKIIRSKIMTGIMNTALNRIEMTKRRQRAQAHSSAAKYVATDIAMKNANMAMDIAGTAGLGQSSGIEKIFRRCQVASKFMKRNEPDESETSLGQHDRPEPRLCRRRP